MFTPIIFFLGFTSRECLYLNTVFLLIVSLHRFKVLAIFLYYVDKFFFFYWPEELFLRILKALNLFAGLFADWIPADFEAM